MARNTPAEFTPEDCRQLDHQRFHHPHCRVRQRAEVLWLISQGEPVGRAATLGGVSRITAWRYGQDYRLGGIEGLCAMKWEGTSSELEPHRAALEAWFTAHPPHTVDEAAQEIERITGLRRRPTAVREFLRSMDLRWRRTAAVPVPPKKTLPSMPGIRPNSYETSWDPA